MQKESLGVICTRLLASNGMVVCPFWMRTLGISNLLTSVVNVNKLGSWGPLYHRLKTFEGATSNRKDFPSLSPSLAFLSPPLESCLALGQWLGPRSKTKDRDWASMFPLPKPPTRSAFKTMHKDLVAIEATTRHQRKMKEAMSGSQPYGSQDFSV